MLDHNVPNSISNLNPVGIIVCHHAQLVATILGQLHDPKDAAACGMTCQRMHAAVQAAALRLRIQPCGEAGIADEAARLERCLSSLPQSFPGSFTEESPPC